jgi:hypothetical protein
MRNESRKDNKRKRVDVFVGHGFRACFVSLLLTALKVLGL